MLRVTGGSSLGRWLRRSTAGDTARQDLSGNGNRPGFEARAEALETGQRAASSASLTPGQMFGPYRVEKEVGRGAMAAVYRCTDERDGRIIATSASLRSGSSITTRFAHGRAASTITEVTP